MNEPARRLCTSFAEYLAMEQASETRHEYLDGEIYAMAGGTPEHGLLCANAIRELGVLLRGRGCTVYTSDVRVRVQATGLTTYPDVTVVCGRLERDPEDRNAIANPIMLVEVLSAGTESYDREQKFAHYRRIPSLREYLLVSQRERHVEHYRRNDDGTWTLRDVWPPDVVDLGSIRCALSLEDLYQGVFDAAEPGAPP
jgi:Uma2 family endonuclease